MRAAAAAKGDSVDLTIAPLPSSDRTGAVVGLLMLPTLIGGYAIATLLFAHRLQEPLLRGDPLGG